MPRHLLDATPKYALVVWPDEPDQTLPSCIQLAGVPDALAYGALLVGVEDAEFCYPRDVIEPWQSSVRRQHPYRRSANWHKHIDEGEDTDA